MSIGYWYFPDIKKYSSVIYYKKHAITRSTSCEAKNSNLSKQIYDGYSRYIPKQHLIRAQVEKPGWFFELQMASERKKFHGMILGSIRDQPSGREHLAVIL